MDAIYATKAYSTLCTIPPKGLLSPMVYYSKFSSYSNLTQLMIFGTVNMLFHEIKDPDPALTTGQKMQNIISNIIILC